jgi:CBS domain-containing protein
LQPPSATLAEVMKKMLEWKVHRIYVVNGDFKPIGVVAALDIITAVATILQ